MTEQAAPEVITADDVESAAICGLPRPWGAAAVLCGFRPGHAGYHAWDREDADEAGDGPAHVHHWAVLNVQPHTPWVMLGKPIPHTVALLRCTDCRLPDTVLLTGEWTLAQVRELEAEGE